jgi:hypothetical protein
MVDFQHVLPPGWVSNMLMTITFLTLNNYTSQAGCGLEGKKGKKQEMLSASAKEENPWFRDRPK